MSSINKYHKIKLAKNSSVYLVTYPDRTISFQTVYGINETVLVYLNLSKVLARRLQKL